MSPRFTTLANEREVIVGDGHPSRSVLISNFTAIGSRKNNSPETNSEITMSVNFVGAAARPNVAETCLFSNSVRQEAATEAEAKCACCSAAGINKTGGYDRNSFYSAGSKAESNKQITAERRSLPTRNRRHVRHFPPSEQKHGTHDYPYVSYQTHFRPFIQYIFTPIHTWGK